MASDYPITAEPNPLEGIQIGATRMNLDADPETLLNREERVSVEQLIHSATDAAAYQLRAESRLGSIEVGKSRPRPQHVWRRPTRLFTVSFGGMRASFGWRSAIGSPCGETDTPRSPRYGPGGHTRGLYWGRHHAMCAPVVPG